MTFGLVAKIPNLQVTIGISKALKLPVMALYGFHLHHAVSKERRLDLLELRQICGILDMMITDLLKGF
jgi:hypothetical protein